MTTAANLSRRLDDLAAAARVAVRELDAAADEFRAHGAPAAEQITRKAAERLRMALFEAGK